MLCQMQVRHSSQVRRKAQCWKRERNLRSLVPDRHGLRDSTLHRLYDDHDGYGDGDVCVLDQLDLLRPRRVLEGRDLVAGGLDLLLVDSRKVLGVELGGGARLAQQHRLPACCWCRLRLGPREYPNRLRGAVGHDHGGYDYRVGCLRLDQMFRLATEERGHCARHFSGRDVDRAWRSARGWRDDRLCDCPDDVHGHRDFHRDGHPGQNGRDRVNHWPWGLLLSFPRKIHLRANRKGVRTDRV